jgi:hypothetical protein
VDPAYRDAMTALAVDLALEHDAFLYSIYSFSALHIAKTTSDLHRREEAMIAYRKYLDISLREHRVDITNLNKANATAVCLT